MPQLDIMSFFTQFFWFSLSFLFFYIFVLHYILPVLVLNLKFRQKMLEFLVIDIDKRKYLLGISSLYDNILQKVFSFFRLYISKVFNFTYSWISLNLFKTNSSYFELLNALFLQLITERVFCVFLLDHIIIKKKNTFNLNLINSFKKK